tara:strand:- start:20414 stop:20824 length:411 start_codon:yes stop_codon:yes gene_type:complete
MKLLLLGILFVSFNSFARSPAVDPGFKARSLDGKNPKEFIYINGRSVELSKIGFKGSGVPNIKRKLEPKTESNLAPTFLMLFALSIPLFAWIFIRDENNEFQEVDENNSISAEILEVDFTKESTNSNQDDKIKKAS